MFTAVLLDLTWKLPLMVAVFSLGEWLIHKHMLHGKWLWKHGPRSLKFVYQDHAIDHHGNERNERLPYIDLTAKDYWPMLIPLCFHLFRWLSWGDVGGLSHVIAIGSVTIAHRTLWNVMHREIHGLTHGSWAVDLPWYYFIREHHEGHHRDPRKNLNVVFPLCDYIFGTVYREPVEQRGRTPATTAA